MHTFELRCVQCSFVVISCPDVVDLAAAIDQKLIDIFCRATNVAIGWTVVPFLVSTKTTNPATFLANVASGQGDVHQRADGAIVIIAPDDPFFIGGDAFAALTVFGFRNPSCGLGNIFSRNAANFCSICQRHVSRFHRLVQAA